MMDSHLLLAPITAMASAHSNITMVELDAPLWLKEEDNQSNLFYEGWIVSCRKSAESRLSL
ncbi:hypothetical protein RYX56_16550 [Alkalihalophilus lindianensis]|uniref:Uncharacterized protein n=2 Tax=Alkalihalophilus lindianensis TaxID=1630542 RepID=A0ABU3XF08_9BACI|nr:hypothetical protein [Alkalihalophilus lindianensis]